MAPPLHVPREQIEGRMVTASQLRPRRSQILGRLPASYLARSRRLRHELHEECYAEQWQCCPPPACNNPLHCTFTRIISCICTAVDTLLDSARPPPRSAESKSGHCCKCTLNGSSCRPRQGLPLSIEPFGHCCRCTPGEWTLSAHETTDLTVTQLAREVVREKIFRYTQQVTFLAYKWFVAAV